MTPLGLLADLSRRGVCLTADGDRLHYRAPRGAVTSDLPRVLTRARYWLLAYLAVTAAGDPWAIVAIDAFAGALTRLRALNLEAAVSPLADARLGKVRKRVIEDVALVVFTIEVLPRSERADAARAVIRALDPKSTVNGRDVEPFGDWDELAEEIAQEVSSVAGHSLVVMRESAVPGDLARLPSDTPRRRVRMWAGASLGSWGQPAPAGTRIVEVPGVSSTHGCQRRASGWYVGTVPA